MSSFDKLASVTASTKRSGGVAGGLEVGFVEHVATLSCTPLDPVDPELAQEYNLAWSETLVTYVAGVIDILEGDILVVATVEYPIKAVADWAWKDTVYKMLLLEDQK